VINRIADFAPHGTERGTGLALQDEAGRFVFCLAGTRHHCPPGELFYAGIGGHLEEGEDWLSCVHREVKEEIGVDVEVLSSPVTWYVPQDGTVQKVMVADSPQPFALYELIYPSGIPRAGQLYRVVVYKASLSDKPMVFSQDELRGVIALTEEQVILNLERKPSIAELQDEGAKIIAGDEYIDRRIRLYPVGTAYALAQIFHLVDSL
jgi:ADP-ribose pyrophosphatase YjhB (NUDIX family)